jgi:hypothetical protein
MSHAAGETSGKVPQIRTLPLETQETRSAALWSGGRTHRRQQQRLNSLTYSAPTEVTLFLEGKEIYWVLVFLDGQKVDARKLWLTRLFPKGL